MSKKDVKSILSTNVDQPFIIEVLIGLSMIVTSIVMMISSGPDPTLVSTVVAGILVIFYAFYYYLKRTQRLTQKIQDEEFHIELKLRMNETFIIQLIFGAAMVIAGLFNIILYGFDMNFIMTAISGILLLIYSIRYYQVRSYVVGLGEKGDSTFKTELHIKLNETFIIQLIFGVAMVIAPLIMMFSYGFDMNLIMTIISGGLLIIYSIYYYRLKIALSR
ncbi:MAG: hypothetical protein ACTSYB_15955 [Candidatus Helarchaeota archaeon]